MERKLELLKQHIDALLEQKEYILIAIDGPCTSGKTTLSAYLKEMYDCNLFHMDDFFLRPEQRTARRFAEVGGNVDYERFMEEVLQPLQQHKPFSYRPFDCSRFALAEPISVSVKRLNIIEGSYSHHSYFGNPYDLKVILRIEPDTQRQRVLQRSSHLHNRFFEEWIPMENRYFASKSSEETADCLYL